MLDQKYKFAGSRHGNQVKVQTVWGNFPNEVFGDSIIIDITPDEFVTSWQRMKDMDSPELGFPGLDDLDYEYLRTGMISN